MPSASSLNGAVVAVSAASDNSTALEKNGTLWTWGSGYPGNGNGLFLSTSPIQASFSGSMVAMTSQASLDTSGTVWAWGDNMYDQLGVGEAGSYATLPLIVNLSTATAPMLSITSGSSQSVMDGSFSTPLTITATSGGNPVANTLVIVQNSSGLIVSSTNAPVYSGILQVQTNGSGQASVYYQEPANGQGTSEILATSGNQQSPFFMMLSANGGVPLMSRWMMVALVLLLFALGVYSLLKKRVSVSA